MPSLTKVRSLRIFERVLLLFILIWTAVFAIIFIEFSLDRMELLAGVGILILLLLVRTFIQHSIDVWYTVALSQINYAHDDAFTALFERSPVAYLTIDPDGTIVESNPAAIKLLDTEVGKITQTNFFTQVAETEELDMQILREKVRAGMTLYDVELPLTTCTDESKWVMLSTYAYRGGSKRLLALVDITEQKLVDIAKSDFVALATHQLRTPIAAIRWNVELLQKSLGSVASEAQARYLTAVERNVLRMIALINDFLSVSKLEMGTYAASDEEIDLTEFFSSVVEEFAGKIAEKQIEFVRTELPPHVTIKIDSRLSHIIVSNLVSNAVKYLRPQGRVELSYQLQGEELTINVADNGIGIPEGELDKLFTKFYRASNAQSHQAEGTGLGLYIVKQSVDLLKGNITVESRQDIGTRFTVVLPVQVIAL